jgi:hypothetical protein
LGLPVYDFSTGGCRDGMGATELNQNQGAESTICFLLALLKMLEVGHEESDTSGAGRDAAQVWGHGGAGAAR